MCFLALGVICVLHACCRADGADLFLRWNLERQRLELWIPRHFREVAKPPVALVAHTLVVEFCRRSVCSHTGSIWQGVELRLDGERDAAPVRELQGATRVKFDNSAVSLPILHGGEEIRVKTGCE